MKSCPKCNRTFPDEGQKFCTFDGGLLIAPQTFDPNATIRATSIDLNAASERPTSRDLPDPNATIIENYPATVALPRNTGPTGPRTSDMSSQPATTPPPPSPPPPPPPPPVVEQPKHVTAEVVVPPAATAAPSAPLPPGAAPQKKSKMPWVIAGVLLFLLVGGGVLAGLFFFVVKPRLDERAANERNTNRTIENTNVATPSPSASIEAPSPSPEDTFQPPAGTVQFVNAKDNLDGKLAEHYFDFSFYYPESWVRDRKSGVAGATNFVKVDKVLPPDFTQENFAVGWYTSTGTFAQDLQSYKERVKEFSNSLAKIIPEYRQISEGPTKVNSMQGYEFRWEGLSKGTERGDLKLWGRVIFLPTGNEGDTAGATLSMLTTSLAPDLSSVEDVGEKGESPVILESFRFGKKN